MHRLKAPAAVDKAPCQPVKQSGMRRATAEFAKIARRPDDAAAEVAVPQAIHHHTRGERVVPAGDPLSQRHSPAASRPALERVEPDGRRFIVAGDDARETSLNHWAMVVVFAAQLDSGDRHTRFIRRPKRVA